MKKLIATLGLAFALCLASAGALALCAPAPARADTGSISGTVYGGEFYWVSVDVYHTNNMSTPAYSAVNPPDYLLHTYSVTGILPGDYKVGFSIGKDQSSGTQFYNGKGTFKSADLVTVIGGKDTPLGPTTMHPAGTISGHVSSAGGALAGASVTAYNSAGEYAGNSSSQTDGSWSISGLGDVSYTVRFLDSGYDDQWYDGKDAAHADSVAVSAGNETGGIDAVLVLTGSSLPVIDWVTSSTHPDPTKWYSSGNPSFSWQTTAYGQTVVGYSCALDQSPATTPGESVVTTAANYGYSGKADGVWYFHVRAETSAGWGAPAHFQIQIDTTAPAGSFTLNGGAATTTTPNVAVGSAVSDANGVSGMRFSTDGKATWSSWASYSASATLTLPAGNGAKTVWGQYEDPAGNVFESSAAITLAAPAPAPSPTPSPTPISAATLKLQLSGLKGGAL